MKQVPIFIALLPALSFQGCTTHLGQSRYFSIEQIKDYQPRPMLVTESHPVAVPKFPAVDIHTHFELGVDPQALIDAMDRLRVTRIINLSGGWGEQLDQMLEKFHTFAPDRLVIFCNVDFSRVDEPEFGSHMADYLTAVRERGVGGLKVFKDLGLRVRDSAGGLVAIDDPRLDAIWRRAGELDMPVLIHTADPAAFFKPIDRFNERWLQLKRHPNWNFHGQELPSREQLLDQRNRVMARHPDTIFIGAHVGNNAEDLNAVAQVLDDYPNFYVDISGRVAELGRQPYSARQFMIDYQDRVLFGTDRYPGRKIQPRYHIYYRFLETGDEYFDYYDHPFPPAGEWKIYGVYLPDNVLEKIYYLNAEKVLGLDSHVESP